MIDTTQLYDDLLKVAQRQNSTQVYAVAQKLMQKLKGEVLGSQTGNGDLTYKDVSSLANFIQHLQDKRIQYNGAYLILGPATIEEAKKDATNKLEGLYVPIYDGKLYLYKDGLIAYLEQLKGQASANATAAGKLLALALGKIEEQAQSAFNIQLTKKEPAQESHQAPQTTQEIPQSQNAKQGPNKQVSYQEPEENGEDKISAVLTDAAKETGGSENITFPYRRDDISIPRVVAFLEMLQRASMKSDFISAVGIGAVRAMDASIDGVYSAIRSFQSVAPDVAKYGFKFPLSGSVSPDAFITTYANNNRGTAINMIGYMVQVCNLLNSVMSNLRDAAKYSALESIIEDQINLGDSYITNFEHFMSAARTP